MPTLEIIMKLLSVGMFPVVSAWTRYNPSEGVYFASSGKLSDASNSDLTPWASLPIQDNFYFWMSVTHAYIVIPVLVMGIAQWCRVKGDPMHVKMGTVIKWFLVFLFLQGWVLHVRHSFLSEPEAFAQYPPILELPLQQPGITAFGLSLALCIVQAFFVGIKDPERRIGLRSPMFWILFAGHVGTLAATVWFYVTAIGKAINNCPGNFLCEISWEMMVTLSVLPIWDGCNIWAMLGWLKFGELNWKEHHVMNVIWVTTLALSAVLVFFAHDARRVFAYPGIGSFWVRLAIQVVPQVVVLAPYARRLIQYVMTCGPNQSKDKDEANEKMTEMN